MMPTLNLASIRFRAHSAFTAAGGVVLLAALLLAAILPTFAAESGKETPADQCRGVDMLAEMQAREPEVYRTIIDQAEATENTKAVLWKIEREGVKPSFLLGTVHLTDERVTTLSENVTSALADTTAIALEVADLSQAATVAAISHAAKLVMFTDGRRLNKLLAPEEFEAVKAAVVQAGMPAELAPLFKPWIVTMILSVSECERRKVQAGDRVLDMKIAEAGEARGVPVIGLETIEEQLSALASIPEDQQLEMLRASLKFAHRTDDLMETTLQLYLNRQMGRAIPFQIELARKAGGTEAAFSGFQQQLLVNRNAKMRNEALPMLDKGGAFIAVGALHLTGKDGLVELIRQAGYTVTPVE